MVQFKKYLEIIQEMKENNWKENFINFMKNNKENFHKELLDRIRTGPALKTWNIKLIINKEEISMLEQLNSIIKGLISINNKIKLNSENTIKFDWIDFVNFLVNPKNNPNYLLKEDFNEIGFKINTMYGLYKMIGNEVGNLEQHKEKISKGRLE
jgi:hypothetical protein